MTDPTSKHAPEYQQEGYTAYAAGQRPQSCPYAGTDNTFGADQWFRGYAWARTDQIQANRIAQRSGT